MKKSAKNILTLSCLASLMSLSGCAIGKGRVNPDDYIVKPSEQTVLSFVAATKTAWDADVSLGGLAFKVEMKLMGDKKVTLVATHEKAVEQAPAASIGSNNDVYLEGEGGGNTTGDQPGGENQGSDSGGSDDPAGGDAGNTGGDTTGGENQGSDNTGGDAGNTGGDAGNTGGDTTGGENQGSDNTGGDTGNTGGNTGGENQGSNSGGSDGPGGGGNSGPSMEDGDYTITINGTWELEEGWGYVVSLEDASSTTLYVNYDEDTGRHYTYYKLNPNLKNADGEDISEQQVTLQAKDSTFRNKLNENYVIHEERVATYSFHGGGFDSGTGNKIEARLWLENDGTACALTSSGSEDTYRMGGTWTEDKTNHVVTVDIGGSTYTTDAYCSTAGKEGYRLTYNSSTCYAPANDTYGWYDYTFEDFDGKIVYTFENSNHTLELTEKGLAYISKSGSIKDKLNYTYDSKADVFTFTSSTYAGQEWKTTLANGVYTVTVKYQTTVQISKVDNEVTVTMAK